MQNKEKDYKMDQTIAELRQKLQHDFTQTTTDYSDEDDYPVVVGKEMVDITINVSEENLLQLFNELDHTLDKYLIDTNLKYDMVSNEIQVENNNNERNLDIYQSTSEIIHRNIMSSTEEIQALISQIYANTTIIIHTGDSLEYANKAKYKLTIAKKSMEIMDSTDPLSLINGLFDNMPFNDENIDYIVHILKVVTYALPNVATTTIINNNNSNSNSTLTSTMKVTNEILIKCIQNQLEKVKGMFHQSFAIMDINTMKSCALTYKKIDENIISPLQLSTSSKNYNNNNINNNSINNNNNLLHIEFINKSLQNLCTVTNKYCPSNDNNNDDTLHDDDKKENAQTYLKEMFKTSASTYNKTMSTIIQIFDTMDQHIVQGILINEIILNSKFGLFKSINNFIGIPIEMEMFEHNDDKNVYIDGNDEEEIIDNYCINKNINLNDLLWVFSEINQLFLSLPVKFNDSDTIFSTLTSLFLPFKKQFMIYEEKKINRMSQEMLLKMFNNTNTLVSTDLIIKSQNKLHVQFLNSYKNCLQLFLSVNYNNHDHVIDNNSYNHYVQPTSRNDDNNNKSKYSLHQLPSAFKILLEYILPLYKKLCNIINIACNKFNDNTDHSVNVENSIKFYQSLIDIIETHYIGNRINKKILSNITIAQNSNRAIIDPEHNKDDNRIVRAHITETYSNTSDFFVSFFTPFYEEKYVLISTIERLINKTIKNWLTSRLKKLKDMIEKEYKVTTFMGEESTVFNKISNDFINILNYMKTFMDGNNLEQCMINYLHGFFSIFFNHILSNKYKPEQGVQIKWDIQQLEKKLINNIFKEISSYDLLTILKLTIEHFKRVLEILIVIDYRTAESLCNDLIKENRLKYEQSALSVLRARNDAVG